MAKSKLIPLRDMVVIEAQTPDEVTESGIVIPDTADKDAPQQGTVVAVGLGRVSEDGSRVEMEVEKGDVVLFSKYGPTKVKINGKEYLVAKEEDIYAKLED
jgi:chaperonin GroES